MSNLEERVHVLERRVGRWMKATVALSLLLVIIVTTGAVMQTQKVVRASRFEVVDDLGRTVGILATGKQGGQIEIFSNAGRSTTLIGHGSKGGGLVAVGSRKGLESVLLGGSDLGGQLRLKHANGEEALRAGAFSVGTVDLSLNSPHGAPVFETGSRLDRNGFLTIKSRYGKRLFDAGTAEGSGFFGASRHAIPPTYRRQRELRARATANQIAPPPKYGAR